MPGNARKTFFLSYRTWSCCLVAHLFASLTLAVVARANEEIDWAKEQQFWSFRAPVGALQPAVKSRQWPTQPLDYLVLNRLEKSNLAPSQEADRRTLIRRVAFDLTGLPPTPEEVRSVLADKQPAVYERLVDRLLASPQFGERMASLWLPLVRYAEDQAHLVGTETQSFYPNAYKYREWVIKAFNRDLPYDRFITLQLAADRVVEKNSADLAALGFVGLGPKYYNRDQLGVQADEWEDRVDTVARSFLGLTVACARCHDHKFDPITMRDYYGLAGVFASTRMVNKMPDGKNVDGKTLAEKMPADALHIVEEGETKDLNVFPRGNIDRRGPVAERRFLRVLSRTEPAPFKDGSGRRELAAAIANRSNPLTARVMVNRMWGCFFGQALVGTPSNFGHSGQAPSNPELLDTLAVRFMDSGWSIKTLVREIVLSSTYRQSSNGEVAKGIDPGNQLLSRMNRRRMSIEQWRDAALFASGELQPIGGKSLELDDSNNLHRTVYARISRLKLNDLLMQFDYPDANVHAEKRATTTTPVQKLFLLNSSFMLARSQALANRLAKEAGKSDTARIRRAYELLFGREPERVEITTALAFLRGPGATGSSRWDQYAQILLASNEMFYVD